MGIASIWSAAVDTLNSITEVGINNVSRPSAYAVDVQVDFTGIPMNVSTRTCWFVLLNDHSKGAG
jgi:hypothetical protein